MRTATRLLTVLTALALVLSAPLAQAAQGGSDPVARQQRQLVHSIDKVTAALTRAVKDSRVEALTEPTRRVLRANVEADKLELEDIRLAVPTTTDLRQARKDLKEFRTVNYVLVVNVLRKAERLLVGATTNAPATAALTAVVSEALEVDAQTDKAALRDVRADLKAAQALL